jgi:hypothetical protein
MTAATDIKETNDHCIKRFAFCINVLWVLRLAIRVRHRQKCYDALRKAKQKSWIFLWCFGLSGDGQSCNVHFLTRASYK